MLCYLDDLCIEYGCLDFLVEVGEGGIFWVEFVNIDLLVFFVGIWLSDNDICIFFVVMYFV